MLIELCLAHSNKQLAYSHLLIYWSVLCQLAPSGGDASAYYNLLLIKDSGGLRGALLITVAGENNFKVLSNLWMKAAKDY